MNEILTLLRQPPLPLAVVMVVIVAAANTGIMYGLKLTNGFAHLVPLVWTTPLAVFVLGLFGLLMSNQQLGIIFPLISGTVNVMVLLAGALFLGEQLTLQKVSAVSLIVTGIIWLGMLPKTPPS